MAAEAADRTPYPKHLALSEPSPKPLELVDRTIKPLHDPNRSILSWGAAFREYGYVWRDYVLGVGIHNTSNPYFTQTVARWIYHRTRRDP